MNHARACEILGVSPDADETTIKLSYHQLVRVWHPDRFADDAALQERAERQLREINAAHDVCLKHDPAATPRSEVETPWYPPPNEAVVRSSYGEPVSNFRRPDGARPNYDGAGLFLLFIVFAVGALMIVLAT